MSAPVVSAFVPILRGFDEGQTRDFYLRYLGFDIAFEHRFDPGGNRLIFCSPLESA